MFGLAIAGSAPLPRFDIDDEVPVSCLCSDSGVIFLFRALVVLTFSCGDFEQGVQGAGVLWVAFDPEGDEIVFRGTLFFSRWAI